MMDIKQEMTTYFGNRISGFVGNKYIVHISSMDIEDLRFYAKSVSLPYETLNMVEDIYVSFNTLARPKNVISVQTYSDLNITFNMDSENRIIKKLTSIFKTNHNLSTFETTRSRANILVKVEVFGHDGLKVNEYSYSNCEIFNMESYDLDASDRKFKEYKVTFTCNRISKDKTNSGYSDTKSNPAGQLLVASCPSLLDAYNKAYAKYLELLHNPVDANGKPLEVAGRFDANAYEIKGGASSVANEDALNIHLNAINQSGILNRFLEIVNRGNKCPVGMPSTLNLKNPAGATGFKLKDIIYRQIKPELVSFAM